MAGTTTQCITAQNIYRTGTGGWVVWLAVRLVRAGAAWGAVGGTREYQFSVGAALAKLAIARAS